jgi:hypothetical protein
MLLSLGRFFLLRITTQNAIKNHQTSNGGSDMLFTGYIVRETEKAVAFVLEGEFAGEVKPLWVPHKKIDSREELDSYSPSIQIAGESVRRLGIPVRLEIDSEFLKRVGIA